MSYLQTWSHLGVFAEGGPGRYDPADRAGLSLHQNPVFEPYLSTDAKGRLVVYSPMSVTRKTVTAS